MLLSLSPSLPPSLPPSLFQTMMWGGSDEPCALCQVASLGAINLKNNKAVCSEVCQLLSEVLCYMIYT
jgi:hypothetical protein